MRKQSDRFGVRLVFSALLALAACRKPPPAAVDASHQDLPDACAACQPGDGGALDAALSDAALPDAAGCPAEVSTLVCPGSVDPPPCLVDGGPPPTVTHCPLPPTPVPIRALLFAWEDGWGPHPSHCVADSAMMQCGGQRGWQMTLSRDPADFNTANLANFDVVIFLITGPHALGAPGQEGERAALQAFIRGGGGFAGIHSITATDQGIFGAARWDWFADMVGTTFLGHPPHPTAVQPGVVRKEQPSHPLLTSLPDVWPRCEEWHSLRPNPDTNANLELLLTLDESCTPAAGLNAGLAMGHHPLAWRRTYEGGRVFITVLGHTAEAYNEPAFLQHVTLGVEWAAGR